MSLVLYCEQVIQGDPVVAHEFVFDLPGNVVLAQVTQTLNAAGFRVEQSFDLRSALALVPDCSCQHHGTALCDCQYVVLLVYYRRAAPVTLVIHSHDGRSWVMLADNLNRHPSVFLKTTVASTLSSIVLSG